MRCIPCRGRRFRAVLFAASSALLVPLGGLSAEGPTPAPFARRSAPEVIYVDGARGSDQGLGSKQNPLRTISAAIALLPDPLTQSATIEWSAGRCETTGGHDMASNSLELMRRMRPGVKVRIIGKADAGEPPQLAWEGATAMVDAREGDWWLENVQVGSGSTRQRRGVMTTGPAHVTLKNVTFRTRSHSDAAIYACRGGRISLRGAIKINEHLHDHADDETFAGIIADTGGVIEFVEKESASLDMGNGSLSAHYYGIIGLGCKTARITSWGEQSNTLAINNSGRLDLHDTEITLCARNPRNTPIGLEHDGHILAEGAHIIIVGENNHAIALQKASTLTGNGIELRGKFKTAVWATSGSMFVGRFLGDITGLQATTGASINVEATTGQVIGPVKATRCGMISLPDRNVVSAATPAE